ncbi:prolyl oligopeptidase family serine peptidase [Caenimonas koreensis DSM 17982]|uniref:Prolyl oligopeptidase family serine peptidase n=2 Tax=Caenimonas TaxID=763439 RepID=A0A844BDX8_9BURK|nr:prolyl oligopeptidase family serine peptidase [Caenimonas koreensis DSM 17982]
MQSSRWMSALVSLFVAGTAFAQRVPMATADEPFAADALVKGVSATRESCAQLQGGVWADAGSFGAECLRSWVHGLDGDVASNVLVYLPPDQLTFNLPAPGYTSLSPSRMAALTAQMQRSAGVPFIFLARPGTFGSSGTHGDRRREAEARLVSAALDALRRKHGITRFVVSGLSGGGHTVAALLGWRSDIVCAVAASAVSSPRMRWQAMGQSQDVTGHSDSYEPVEHLAHLARGTMHPQLRVFVLGDLKDSNVPWATQLPLATRLQQMGVPTQLLNAEGSDAQHHALSDTTRAVGAACAKGVGTPDIVELVKGRRG